MRISNVSKASTPFLMIFGMSKCRESPVIDAGSGVDRPAESGGGVGNRSGSVGGTVEREAS